VLYTPYVRRIRNFRCWGSSLQHVLTSSSRMLTTCSKVQSPKEKGVQLLPVRIEPVRQNSNAPPRSLRVPLRPITRLSRQFHVIRRAPLSINSTPCTVLYLYHSCINYKVPTLCSEHSTQHASPEGGDGGLVVYIYTL
jgi:hypothetical protein